MSKKTVLKFDFAQSIEFFIEFCNYSVTFLAKSDLIYKNDLLFTSFCAII